MVARGKLHGCVMTMRYRFYGNGDLRAAAARGRRCQLVCYDDLLFPGMLEARICTGIGRPVPEPPQLLQIIFPEPLHVLQPISLSDHFVHIHGTLRVPLQVAHSLPPAIGFWSSASRTDFTNHALASNEAPWTICIATPGDILLSLCFHAQSGGFSSNLVDFSNSLSPSNFALVRHSRLPSSLYTLSSSSSRWNSLLTAQTPFC